MSYYEPDWNYFVSPPGDDTTIPVEDFFEDLGVTVLGDSLYHGTGDVNREDAEPVNLPCRDIDIPVFIDDIEAIYPIDESNLEVTDGFLVDEESGERVAEKGEFLKPGMPDNPVVAVLTDAEGNEYAFTNNIYTLPDDEPKYEVSYEMPEDEIPEPEISSLCLEENEDGPNVYMDVDKYIEWVLSDLSINEEDIIEQDGEPVTDGASEPIDIYEVGGVISIDKCGFSVDEDGFVRDAEGDPLTDGVEEWGAKVAVVPFEYDGELMGFLRDSFPCLVDFVRSTDAHDIDEVV